MELRLDRLTLRLSGISAADGNRLAELVGHRLADATPPPTGGSTAAMIISIAARADDSLDSLAQRIVSEMLRSLARSLS
jgi:hypothetical protein